MKIPMYRPVILISLDGWGLAPPSKGNAIGLANLTNLKKYEHTYPSTQLLAAGEAVGLPHGEDGNSEVGHLNMGAGRIVYQDILRINASIADGTFLKNEAFLLAADQVKHNKSTLHIMGLTGSGSVHSYLEHLFALFWFAKEQGLSDQNVRLHIFTDGRDAPPQEAITQIAEIQRRLDKLAIAKIATVSGRYYAMDRDNHWDRIEKTYNCLVMGEGEKAKSAAEAIDQAYKRNITDEFIVPTAIVDDAGKPIGTINDGDAVIFFNFRPDRARQLAKVFVLPNFEQITVKQYSHGTYHSTGSFEETTIRTFTRKKTFHNLTFVSMTEYEKGMPVTAVAFPVEEIKMTLSRVIAERNLRQFHLAETEKYAHITYFFNGFREAPYVNEDRIEVPSPKVPTYDLAPEMASADVGRVALEKIASHTYDFILINFAAPDMVGHTGVIPAAIRACEAADREVGRIVSAATAVGGAVIITGDHGNVEEMLDLITGQVDTEHSINPVPFIVCGKDLEKVTNKKMQLGILADIAPTVLGLMGIVKPSEMTGRDLLAALRMS